MIRKELYRRFFSLYRSLSSRPLYFNLSIILVYTIIGLIYTFPLLRNFAIAIPGWRDSWIFYWSFWWFKKALIDLNINPFYTNYIFYPEGTSLLVSTTTPLHAFLSIPFQFLIGLIATFNLFTLLTFVLSAWGTYLLVKYLVKNDLAALLAGFLYGFCPWRMVKLHVGHHNLLSTEGIPFFALFLIKTFEEESWLNPVLAGFFLALVYFTEATNFVFLVFFALLYFVYRALANFRLTFKLSSLKRLIIFSLVTITLVAPLLIPTLIEMSTKQFTQGKVSREESDLFSADLISYVVPTYMHRFLGEGFRGVRRNFVHILDENSMYLGWGALALGMLSIFLVRNRKIIFWAIAFIAFFILSLGHTLHILGRNIFPGFQGPINLPYDLFFNIPFINISRVPSRFFVLAMLAFSVICGFGIKKILDGFIAKKIQKPKVFLFFFAIIFLLFLDYWPRAADFSYPEFDYYAAPLKRMHEDFAVLPLPLGAFPRYLGLQVYTEKKMVAGFTSRITTSAEGFMRFTPLIDHLAFPELFDWNIKMFEQDPSVIGKTLFNYYKIKCLIIYYGGYLTDKNQQQLDRCLQLLNKIGVHEINSGWGGMILEVDRPKKNEIFMEPGENWHFQSNIFQKAMTVKLINPDLKAHAVKMEFLANIKEPDPNLRLSVYFRNSLIGNFKLSEKSQRFGTAIFSLPVGKGEVRFVCETASGRDSFFLNNISLKEQQSGGIK